MSTPKSFFNSESDRNLWIRLNAEHIKYSEKILNDNDKEIGSIDEAYSPMWVSNNQLEYDEACYDKPRFSLEELSSLSHEELFEIGHQRNKESIIAIFGETFDDDDNYIFLDDDY